MDNNWKIDRTPPGFSPVTVTITLRTKEELIEFVNEFGETRGDYMREMYDELVGIKEGYA